MIPEIKPIVSCPAPVPSCAPSSCDLISIYHAQRAMCHRLDSIDGRLTQMEDIFRSISDIPRLLRDISSNNSRLLRLEQSAVICISWNADTCAIQGLTASGTLKVFEKDPCLAGMLQRLTELEDESSAIANLAALQNQVNAMSSTLSTSLKTITLNDECGLVAETNGGASSTVDVPGCIPTSETLKQETVTAGAMATEHQIPFTVNNDSACEICVIFSEQTAADIYNFNIWSAAPATPASVDTATSPTTGNVIIATNHISRTHECYLPAGNYTLRVAEAGGAVLDSLVMSVQIKSLS